MPGVEDSERVYQLRVVLSEVSPLIWRRLQVTGSTTLAQLHQVLQAAFGWDGEHLHEFTVHGVGYGNTGGCHRCGAGTTLAGLGLRVRERFGYAYNFFASWHLDLRVEDIVPADPRRHYPRCLAGNRAGPPQDCDGPDAYLRLRAHSPLAVLRMAEILGELLERPPTDRLSDIGGQREELQGLVVYGRLDDFDRAALNTALADPRTPGSDRRGRNP
jgi:hypothetical protein